MTTSTSTVFLSLGRGIGYTGAVAKHAALKTVSYTGQAGADMLTGITTGYVDHDARLAAIRAGMAAPTKSIAIKVQRTKATA